MERGFERYNAQRRIAVLCWLLELCGSWQIYNPFSIRLTTTLLRKFGESNKSTKEVEKGLRKGIYETLSFNCFSIGHGFFAGAGVRAWLRGNESERSHKQNFNLGNDN
ncbi:MAG: hypothetical protein HY779_00500, partial [Rubrobacteridae bacterium]|nr:hypothetical protein [Rubrobacteridae bacterium]